MIAPRERLIVALDLPDRDAALAAVSRLSGHVGCFKIGLELFVRAGPRLVEEVRGRGENVFLDLKLHDIPNTVAGAVRSACSLGVQMLTLHASGGARMIEAACQAAKNTVSPPILLGVTALTSLAQADADAIGIAGPLSAWVEKLAAIACNSGTDGLVASPIEMPFLRRRFGAGIRLVAPGIRPPGIAAEDQARVVTPAAAVIAGADYLVVGRPILRDADPAGAADRVVGEIAAILADKADVSPHCRG